MPVARLVFPSYQSSNENGGGNHPWTNVQGAGAASANAGASSVRDPNSANMNWLRSFGDGSRGGAAIPAGSLITGIVVGFQSTQSGGAQAGGTYDVSIFKNAVAVASKTGAMPQGSSVGPFGGPNDLWGMGVLATPTYFSTGIYFGIHLNFPTITADITLQAWSGYMDVYYNDPTPQPSSIAASGGSNQSRVINQPYPIQMYAQVTDQGGLGIAGVNVTWRMPPSGASATFDGGFGLTYSAVTNAQGIATSAFFTANGIVGEWNPTVEVTATPALKATYWQTNLSPPPVLVPTNILHVQGTGQSTTISKPFTTLLKARVLDQFGFNMPNVEVEFITPGAGASGTFVGNVPLVVLTDSAGIATATILTANATAGAWTCNGRVAAFPAVTTPFALTNIQDTSPPAATVQSKIGGDNQQAGTGAPFAVPLSVRVSDQYAAPFPGAQVTFTIPSAFNATFAGGGTVATVATNGSGVATSPAVTAGGQAGNYNVTASTPGVVSVTFALKNVDATIITSMVMYGGNNQKAAPSAAFPLPLSVRLLNGLGVGVPGGSVTFTAPGSAASCRFSGALTQVVAADAQGVAASVIPVATATVGAYAVVASHAGLPNVSFSLTNGVNYLPEVCTLLEVPPAGCVNTVIGGVGTPSSWTNPQFAGQPGSSGAYAEIFQNAPNSNQSYFMVAYTHPASWAAQIEDGAQINSVSLVSWGFWDTRGSGVKGTLVANVIVQGATSPGFPDMTMQSGADAWVQTPQQNSVWSFGTKPTGAQWKAANSGIGIKVQVPNNITPGNSVRVNGMTMRVCYQNPDEPVTTVDVPLQFCEA